jgi:hypothetical protein
MRAFLLLTIVSSVNAQASRPQPPAPIDIEKEYPVVPNEWIIVFHPEATHKQISEHMKAHDKTDGVVQFVYNGTKHFRGYAMGTTENVGSSALAYVKDRTADTYDTAHEVHYIEQNRVVKAFSSPNAQCNTQMEATWGLARVGQAKLRIDGLYTHHVHEDTDVKVYVLDTGIYTENVDFQGRAVFGADFTTNTPPKTDLNGHGTHCAGTVAGRLYGVNKDVTVVAVRVLGASGSGTTAGVIAGVDYVAKNGAGKKAVGSMSLGGGKSAASNAAVNAAVDAGVTMVVAAGNSAMDACSFSPASAEKAITVACSDNTDAMCYFSNYGSCTNIIAPGMSITSAWIGSKESDNTISGTSMSCPHVAGAAAHILELSEKTLTPAQVKAKLESTAQKGVITDILGDAKSTPNLLLQSVCEGTVEVVV